MDEKLSPDDVVNLTILQEKLKGSADSEVKIKVVAEKSEDVYDNKA